MRKRFGSFFHDVKATGSKFDKKPGSILPSFIMETRKETNGSEISQPCIAMHRAMIALGSNIGDRVDMIEQACEKMRSRGINVKATSFLYETAPMYVTDQEVFHNAACEVRNYHYGI